MTDAQRRTAIIGLINRHTAANTASKSVARASLIKEGTYTSDGQVKLDRRDPQYPRKQG
ncbi:hypothetical protein [Sphingomonas crocodyli]|uniref:hypothetical protein n=1 Tax=Sphingomonas crocodyli TaxID=1979270 RepID=UPI0013E369C5|nr:hypothetical protein [Sphingomonas crocodyli]